MKMTKTRKKILCTTIVVLIVAFFIGFNHLFIIDMRKEIVPVNETTINSDGQVQVTLTYGGYCNRHLKFRSSFFNIVKAAETLDGLVVAPGEAFSWFEFMGPCDGSQGYKPGIGFGAYMPTLTYGGGVCLCSTLIYKAESTCGMTTIITRRKYPMQIQERTLRSISQTRIFVLLTQRNTRPHSM